MRVKFLFDHPKREQKKQAGFAGKFSQPLINTSAAVTSKSMPPYPAVPSFPNNI